MACASAHDGSWQEAGTSAAIDNMSPGRGWVRQMSTQQSGTGCILLYGLQDSWTLPAWHEYLHMLATPSTSSGGRQEGLVRPLCREGPWFPYPWECLGGLVHGRRLPTNILLFGNKMSLSTQSSLQVEPGDRPRQADMAGTRQGIGSKVASWGGKSSGVHTSYVTISIVSNSGQPTC